MIKHLWQLSPWAILRRHFSTSWILTMSVVILLLGSAGVVYQTYQQRTYKISFSLGNGWSERELTFYEEILRNPFASGLMAKNILDEAGASPKDLYIRMSKEGDQIQIVYSFGHAMDLASFRSQVKNNLAEIYQVYLKARRLSPIESKLLTSRDPKTYRDRLAGLWSELQEKLGSEAKSRPRILLNTFLGLSDDAERTAMRLFQRGLINEQELKQIFSEVDEIRFLHNLSSNSVEKNLPTFELKQDTEFVRTIETDIGVLEFLQLMMLVVFAAIGLPLCLPIRTESLLECQASLRGRGPENYRDRDRDLSKLDWADQTAEVAKTTAHTNRRSQGSHSFHVDAIGASDDAQSPCQKGGPPQMDLDADASARIMGKSPPL